MGKGSGGGTKTRVVEYRLSLHMGIALELDGITEIQFGEKTAWTGDVREEAAIEIHKTDLFGGTTNEGGVSGIAYYLPGGKQQTLCDGLASRMGLTQATCPGFRGFSSIFLVGHPLRPSPLGQKSFLDSLVTTVVNATEFVSLFVSGIVQRERLPRFKTLYNQLYTRGDRGFYLSANNPYLKAVAVKGWRAPKGLDPAKAMIDDDANGAHIIFECLTNTSWGMGSSTGILDIASFEQAASTLYDEEFGLSLIWTRQSTVEEFVSEILDHIQAALFLNPTTGLLTLTLFRDDYDIETLEVIDPSNAKLSNLQRKSWAETINELTVTYTNPDTEEDATVTVQDLGNIAMQGASVSDSRNYYAVRNADTAAKLAERDIATASAPLATCEAELKRSLWQVRPGKVYKLVWSEEDIEQMFVRVVQVDYGTPDNAVIKVSLTEDIFSATSAVYTPPPTTEFEDPASEPAPIDYMRVITAPAYMAAVSGGVDLTTYAYPQVAAAVLTVQDDADTFSMELLAEAPAPGGGTQFTNLGSKLFASRAELDADLPWEVSSTITEFPFLLGSTPVAGDFLFIGNDDDTEAECELCLVTTVTESGWEIMRGALDTIPRAWTAGTTIWLLRTDRTYLDTTIRSDGEEVTYKVLTRTSLGRLDEADAPEFDAELNGRPHYPLRPANVAVAGETNGTADATGMSSIAVTWSNRNRISETGTLLAWDDGSTAPEVGQTTLIRITETDGTPITEITGLTGTSTSVSLNAFGGFSSAIIQVLSVRDGLESFQGQSVTVTNLSNGGAGAITTSAPTSSVSASITYNSITSTITAPSVINVGSGTVS